MHEDRASATPSAGHGTGVPYYVAMNITLSVDERLVRRARKKAEAMGKSLNQLVREYF